MPKLKHTVSFDYKPTFRTEKVAGLFDLPPQEKLTKSWEVDLPIETMEWQIGLIVGASGAGKTTLSKRLFGEENYHHGFEWPHEQSFLEGFPDAVTINEITNSLSHVGFASPPAWLLPFDKLSNGQKFRAEIARILLEPRELTIIDEFTSVVDRTVAQIGSAAVAKYIRKTNKKIVAVSCHYDIIDWLTPDWVYDVSANQFYRGSLRRPAVHVDIFQCHYKAWQLFKEHHYLTAELSNAAQCFVAFVNNKPAAFTSYIHFMHPHIKSCKREHRTVVLPDYQGIGLGNYLADFVAQSCLDKGFNYISTTSHPAFIYSRAKSKNWAMTQVPKITAKNSSKIKTSAGRMVASFRYIGDRK